MSSQRQLAIVLLSCLGIFCVLPFILAAAAGYLGDPSMRNPYADKMHMACCNGDTKAIQSLLHQGADVNAPVWEDTTAVMWATEYKHPGTVEVLLAAGANVNAESSHFGPVASWGVSDNSTKSRQISSLLKAAGARLQDCNIADFSL